MQLALGQMAPSLKASIISRMLGQQRDIQNSLKQVMNEISKSGDKDKEKQIILENLDTFLVINTQKSNDWSIVPFIFPVGVLALKPNKITISENISQEVVKADDFGHFDILDDKWSNMIHNTLSRGCNDRDPVQLEIFRAWLANKINSVIV